MTLAPAQRTRLFFASAAASAMLLGVAIAAGSFFWPAVVGIALGLFLLARLQPLPLATVVLGTVVFGYVVGNRGFAQLSLTPGFPLLPAEAALLLGGGLLLVQSAWRRELPFRRDALNLALLAWMAVGAARFPLDFRVFGLMALRDFTLVYYAAFFFLGQELARDPRSRRFLQNLLLAGCGLVLPLSFLAERFPDAFYRALLWRGVPLIFYKGDLAATFLAVGSVLSFLRFERSRRGAWLATSLGLALAVLAGSNRASLLALAIATLWLAVRGRWRFGAWLAGLGVAAAVAILVGASVLRIPWSRTPVFSAYERVLSLADPAGQRTYTGDETFNKGDNNLFRAVWWRTVVDETVAGNPYVGLGFGYDLAGRFVREYYPESSEEFVTRSPHNVLLTIFGRMGAIGLAAFLLVLALVAIETWRSLSGNADTGAAGAWCAVWALLTSACLGVVLEGPMGAVVFWTLLGVAHGTPRAVSADVSSAPSDTSDLAASNSGVSVPIGVIRGSPGASNSGS